jgi:hypothetical protein
MGREEALLTNIALTDQATQQQDEDGLVSSASSEPKFRVKRWRKDPAPNFVNPSPKAVATTPKPPLNRWEHGHLSSQYKPPSLFVSALGGLPPPALRKRALPQTPTRCEGLQYLQPTNLAVHSSSFVSQLRVHVQSTSGQRSSDEQFGVHADHCLSKPLDLPQSLVRATTSDSTTMLSLHQQLKEQHHLEWLHLLEKAGDASDLVKATRESASDAVHRSRVIAKFAPSTLAAYFRSWNHWVDFCQLHDASPYHPPTVPLADFLQVSSKRSALRVATAQSRALVWISKYAGFPLLKEALEAPITRAYTIPTEVAPRKEAAPSPLSFVVHLESCLLKDIGTPADRPLMGSILVLVWSSLRWSDALWVSPCGLVEDSDIIRGVAAKTKTTSRGTPFAFVKSGLLAVNSQVSWSTKWLNLVRQALQRTSELFPGFKPDFLIPQCGPNLAHPVFSAPLPRSQGVLLLRKLLLQSHRDASVLSVGVHSPKVTLLSWARQIGASEELRMVQGHHRQSGAKFNVGPIWS